MQPVFLFSLPRSGSTLLQRMIASHPRVDTASEPWLLLPLLYMQRQRGMYAEYNHRGYVRARRDFAEVLPNGEEDHREALRSYALSLYRKASSSNATHFLDKTPRYHLIVDQVMETFSDGKFVFLWRNPLSVVASLLNMEDDRSWNLPHYKIDLYKGLEKIIRVQGTASNLHSVQYEDLLAQPDQEMEKIFEYLNLSSRSSASEQFGEVCLEGSLGDPTGTKKYSSLSKEPMQKWKETLNTPVRRAWARRYLQWIGRDRLRVMGYSLDELLEELEALSLSLHHTFSDLVGLARGTVRPWVEPIIMKQKVKAVSEATRVYVHS